MYTIIYNNVMLTGKVTATGNNVGGLVGQSLANNSQTYASYIQNCYTLVENSFSTR